MALGLGSWQINPKYIASLERRIFTSVLYGVGAPGLGACWTKLIAVAVRQAGSSSLPSRMMGDVIRVATTDGGEEACAKFESTRIRAAREAFSVESLQTSKRIQAIQIRRLSMTGQYMNVGDGRATKRWRTANTALAADVPLLPFLELRGGDLLWSRDLFARSEFELPESRRRRVWLPSCCFLIQRLRKRPGLRIGRKSKTRWAVRDNRNPAMSTSLQ